MRVSSIAIPLALIVLCGAALSSLIELRSSLAARSAEEESTLYSANDGVAAARLTSAKAEEESGRAQAATQLLWPRTRSFVHLARVYNSLALGEDNAQKKISYLCQSLSAIGAAVKHEPFNSRYLINWANLRQLLGGMACSEPYTTGAFGAVTQLALERNPTDTRVLYAAALVYYWDSNAARSRELLHQMLQLGGKLSAGQERFVYSTIESEGDVSAVVPARFPQVVVWSSAFRTIDLVRYNAFRGAFGNLEVQAVEASAGEYDRGRIPSELHQQRLLSLFGAESSEASRVTLDTEFSRFAVQQRQRDLAEYLGERAKLRELTILRASLEGDTRPLRSSLSGWGLDEPTVFDEFYRSVGFYVPDGQELTYVQLASATGAEMPSRADVRLLASADNENWIDLTEELQMRSFLVAGAPLLVLRPKHAVFKYWKVQFASPERRGAFKNSLARLVRVFGVSRLAVEEGM